jgi:hypothetical protein
MLAIWLIALKKRDFDVGKFFGGEADVIRQELGK